MKITMTLVKSTKNTHVFKADDDAVVPTLYVKKTAFKGQLAPEFITVEITEGDEL